MEEPPSTFYRRREGVKTPEFKTVINEKISKWLDNEFLLITESGTIKKGIEAFEIWCRQTKLPVEKTLKEFKLMEKQHWEH